MKKYQGISVSPGLVLGQVSLLKRETYLFNRSQHSPEKEELVLEEAVRIAQNELDSMAGRSAVSEQAIFTFQSMLLEDDTFMGEVRSYIQAGTGAAEAMNRVGQRYADKLLAMTDNAYLQLRNVDILDVTQRVVNILAGRPRVLLTLDHPVILAADKLMPSDLFSIPSGMILGIITSEGSSLSHAAIIARARGIPSIIQVGRDFLDDCDGRIVVLDADTGSCILDPDADTRQQTVSRICSRQQAEEDVLETPVRTMPCRTRDGAGFELLANCFGPEDIGSALKLGAAGVGLLRSDYQILAGNAFDEQEQYYYYAACIAAAGGKPITVRTFDFGSDRTLSNVYKGDQSAHLGMRGIRSSLRQPRRFENQIRALLRAGTIGPLRIVFPMVTSVVDWDDVIGTNDLTQYTHAAGREVTSAERYFQPTSKAMYKLIRMTVDAAEAKGIPVSICGLAAGDPANAVQYLHMGLRSFSMGPQNLLSVKKALLEADALPDREGPPTE